MVVAREHHDQPQVGGHQPVSSFDVPVLFVADGEVVFFGGGEEGVATNLSQVTLERIIGYQRGVRPLPLVVFGRDLLRQGRGLLRLRHGSNLC